MLSGRCDYDFSSYFSNIFHFEKFLFSSQNCSNFRICRIFAFLFQIFYFKLEPFLSTTSLEFSHLLNLSKSWSLWNLLVFVKSIQFRTIALSNLQFFFGKFLFFPSILGYTSNSNSLIYQIRAIREVRSPSKFSLSSFISPLPLVCQESLCREFLLLCK